MLTVRQQDVNRFHILFILNLFLLVLINAKLLENKNNSKKQCFVVVFQDVVIRRVRVSFNDLELVSDPILPSQLD